MCRQASCKTLRHRLLASVLLPPSRRTSCDPASPPCLQAKRAQLALAYGRPWAPPPAPPDHRTYLCQEAAWLAVDFAQVRCERKEY